MQMNSSFGVTALRLEGVPQRCGPLGYFVFARIPLSPSRQLDREIANGSALHITTMNFESRGLMGEPVEQRIAAAATHDVKLAQLFSRNLSQIAKYLRVTSGQTVQDEAGEGRRIMRPFLKRIETRSLSLLVDAGGHVAG